MMTYKKGFLIFFFCFCLHPICSRESRAQEPLMIAVAANFAPAMAMIGKNFTRSTDIPTQVSVSSSGRLYSQIRNGAPFDLFFSADSNRPELLFTEGRCEQPEVYVNGLVVLWSRDADLCRDLGSWQDAVKGPGLKRIGMANPELAPYGTVAKDALLAEKLWNTAQDRLVFGNNVAQAFQYAATGAADASFTALSLAHTTRGEQGCFLPVPEAEPVAQSVCVVENSTNKIAAKKFLSFLLSKEIKAMLFQYGYKTLN